MDKSKRDYLLRIVVSINWGLTAMVGAATIVMDLLQVDRPDVITLFLRGFLILLCIGLAIDNLKSCMAQKREDDK